MNESQYIIEIKDQQLTQLEGRNKIKFYVNDFLSAEYPHPIPHSFCKICEHEFYL